MRVVLRGVRVIDPAHGIDRPAHDVLLDDGRIAAIDRRIEARDVRVLELTPPDGRPGCIFCPAFIDLHTHIRHEPAETVTSAARAAAAGGFATIVAMANARNPIDTPSRVAGICEQNRSAVITVLQVAAMTRGLMGNELNDIEACIGAGAVAISDDGRNAAPRALLEQALRSAAAAGAPVLVHPEDELAIRQRAGAPTADITRCVDRPADVEVAAVATALDALERAETGTLHLQHVSSAQSIELLRRARERGLSVTAEVTPHHLSMSAGAASRVDALQKVNPPLRGDADRAALLQALRAGVVDAIATDHAPHPAEAKRVAFADAAPGMIGLETALASLLTLVAFTQRDMPMLVERLTTGPFRVIASSDRIPPPSLHIGEPATATLFDPSAEWTVSADAMQSRSTNTPLIGTRLRGRVLLTIARGAIVHQDERVNIGEAVRV